MHTYMYFQHTHTHTRAHARAHARMKLTQPWLINEPAVRICPPVTAAPAPSLALRKSVTLEVGGTYKLPGNDTILLQKSSNVYSGTTTSRTPGPIVHTPSTHVALRLRLHAHKRASVRLQSKHISERLTAQPEMGSDRRCPRPPALCSSQRTSCKRQWPCCSRCESHKRNKNHFRNPTPI